MHGVVAMASATASVIFPVTRDSLVSCCMVNGSAERERLHQSTIAAARQTSPLGLCGSGSSAQALFQHSYFCVGDFESEPLIISLGSAAGLGACCRDVASSIGRHAQTLRDQGPVHAVSSACGQGGISEEAGDFVSDGQTSATRDLPGNRSEESSGAR